MLAGVVMPPGIKSRAIVATMPTMKIAKIMAKLATPQNETPDSSSFASGLLCGGVSSLSGGGVAVMCRRGGAGRLTARRRGWAVTDDRMIMVRGVEMRRDTHGAKARELVGASIVARGVGMRTSTIKREGERPGEGRCIASYSVFCQVQGNAEDLR